MRRMRMESIALRAGRWPCSFFVFGPPLWPVLRFKPTIRSPSTSGTTNSTRSRPRTARRWKPTRWGRPLEFNWGALPNVHLHIIVPAAAILPSNIRSPRRDGPRAFGLGDIETGIKYRFVQEAKHRPMIGTFVMFELPTGSAARGLGVGKTWYKVPLWVQKSFGPWTTYGGGGETLVNAPGYRNFPFAGWLVQRDLGKKLTLGTEVFYHGPEGPATPQTRPATLIDVGGYYKFRDPGFQLLFCYGHTAIGQTENYAYLGLYWTWGKEGKPGDPPDTAFNGLAPPGLRHRRPHVAEEMH